MAKTKSPKQGHHVPHKVLPLEICQRQPSSQWGYGGGNERRIGCVLLLVDGEGEVELEVLEVREESDEVQYLSGRAIWFFEGKEFERRREVPEALFNDWHKSGHFEVVYPKFLQIRKCGKVVQGTLAEPLGSEPSRIRNPHADPESFDEWKQTKLVFFLEWPWPRVVPIT